MRACASSYRNLFCLVQLKSLGCLYFSEGKWKGSGSVGEGGEGKRGGGVEGSGVVVRI